MKKYREKTAGEIVEAEQWFSVTTDSEGKYHLGVKRLITGYSSSFLTNHSGNKKCIACGAFYQNHGVFMGANGAHGENTTMLVCPGEYVVKYSDGRVYIKNTQAFWDAFCDVAVQDVVKSD